MIWPNTILSYQFAITLLNYWKCCDAWIFYVAKCCIIHFICRYSRTEAYSWACFYQQGKCECVAGQGHERCSLVDVAASSRVSSSKSWLFLYRKDILVCWFQTSRTTLSWAQLQTVWLLFYSLLYAITHDEFITDCPCSLSTK